MSIEKERDYEMGNNTAEKFGITRFGEVIPAGHITIKEFCMRCELSTAEFQRQNEKGAFLGNESVFFGFDGEDDSLFENKGRTYIDWTRSLPLMFSGLTTKMYNRGVRALRVFGFDEKGEALFPDVGVLRMSDKSITKYLSSQKGKMVLDNPLMTDHAFVSRNINEPPQRKCGAANIRQFIALISKPEENANPTATNLGGSGETVDFNTLLSNIDYSNPRDIEKANNIIKMRETYNKAMLSELKYLKESDSVVNLEEVMALIESSVVALRSGISQAVIKMVEDFVGNIITQLSEFDPTIAKYGKEIDRQDLQEILRSDFDKALQIMSTMFTRKADDIEEEEADE